MALFGGVSERLNHIFSKLTKKGRLTELEIRAAMREVRVALLEADVNIKVAKQFIADVSEKAVGQEILSSLKYSKNPTFSHLLSAPTVPSARTSSTALLTQASARSL